MSTLSPTLEIPVPAELKGAVESGTLLAHDGLTLHYTRYSPPTSVPTVASVVFVHGFIEYIGRYGEVFPLFAARGLELIAFDQRGFGNTAINAQGGWSKHYTNTEWPHQFKDVKTIIQNQRTWLDTKYTDRQIPLYLLGHSMGGGISLAIFTRPSETEQAKDLSEIHNHIAGVVGSSPWIVLSKPPPGVLKSIAPSLLRWFPNMKYPANLKPEHLSRDPAVQKAWREDPMVSQWVMLKSAFWPLVGGEKILAEEYKNWPSEKPLLIVHGADDLVTSHKASREFVEKVKKNGAKDAEFQEFPEGKHEMMFEIGQVKSQFANAIIDWILARAQRVNKL